MKKIVIDLDNTLFYTDLLNNFSYNYALKECDLLPINNVKRITRSLVFKEYEDIDDFKKKKILELKQTYFIKNLHIVIPNKHLIELLALEQKENILLWTCADETRVRMLLEYFNILELFRGILFSHKIDILRDVEKLCEIFGCKPEQLIFYEDNRRVIKELKRLKVIVMSIPSEIFYEEQQDLSTKWFKDYPVFLERVLIMIHEKSLRCSF